MSCDGVLSFQEDSVTDNPITLTTAESGIELLVNVNLDILCAKDVTAEKEKSVTLELDVDLNLEFECKDWIYHASISDPAITNVVTKDAVFPMAYHNWNSELTYFLIDIADDFNLHYSEP